MVNWPYQHRVRVRCPPSPHSAFSADIFNLGAELPRTRRGPNLHEDGQVIILVPFEEVGTLRAPSKNKSPHIRCCIVRLKVKSGQRVLIHGAEGGVGTALLQLGSLVGLEMYATCSARTATVVSDLGGIRRHSWSTTNNLSLREREGWRSLRSALPSIWRMRSRVTAKHWPTSSSVCSKPSSRP